MGPLWPRHLIYGSLDPREKPLWMQDLGLNAVMF